MGTTQDNSKEDDLELMREMNPADLERLQRDLSDTDRSETRLSDQRPGGSIQQ